ncbi:precorrin-6y C5,15-methyltransferase (decarboxylating) subunit CbiE [Gottschalkia acidurici]|nr:precorrin-6y C5,15-methyltransferase (decarboxylating) subunit CbiE [Gottschalkia acidurici]
MGDDITIYLVGMGPGNIKNLTIEAIEVLKDSSKIISFGRIGDVAQEFNKNISKVKTLNEIGYLLENKSMIEENIAILASGDPCFYGILEYLKRKEVRIDKIVPGVSSLQYMMSKLKKSWHNSNLVSFHGRDEEKEEKIRNIMKSQTSIILTDSNNTPNNISKLLYEKGLKGKIYAGYNLSYEDEKIIIGNIGDEINYESSLALVVVEVD